VAVNQRLRVRFDCPSPGLYRTLQVMGTATCRHGRQSLHEAAYPWPPPQDAPRHARPRRPVRFCCRRDAFGPCSGGTLTALEFAPDGQVREVSGGTVKTSRGHRINLTLTRNSHSATVNVNALGRIRIQQAQ